AIGSGDLHLQRARGVAAHAEHHRAVAGGAQAAAGVLDPAAGRYLAEHHRALRAAGGEDYALVQSIGAGGGRRTGGQGAGQPAQQYQACPERPRLRAAGRHQRANSRRVPAGAPASCRPSQARAPLTQVEATRDRNVVPSNGDQPHLDSTSSRRTVIGVSSTSTRSAKKPSRRKPRSLTSNSCAGAWANFCTTRAVSKWPSCTHSSAATSANCTSGSPLGART